MINGQSGFIAITLACFD